jgi:hypothetical protein
MVSPLAIRRCARRCHRRGVALLAVAAVGAAIAAHHSGVHHDGMASAAVELCLGVFVAVGTAVAAVGMALLALGPRRPPAALLAVGLSGACSRPPPRARPGPALLTLLCVSRR